MIKNVTLSVRDKLMFKLLHILISVFSLCILTTQEIISKVIIALLCGVIFSIIVFLFYDKLKWKEFIHKNLLVIDSIIIIMLAHNFYIRWLPSSKIALIANLFHLPTKVFLTCTSIILGIMAIGTVDWILGIIIEKIKKIALKRVSKEKAYEYFFIVFVMFLQYVSLQYSALHSLQNIFQQKITVVLFNMLIILAINLGVLLIVQRWRVALCVTSVLFCIWSIANYYVILFHGSPLYFSELVNTKTAFAVAGTYSYELSVPVICAIIILIAQIEYIFKYISPKNILTFGRRMVMRIGMLGVDCLIIYVLLSNIFSHNTGWTAWKSDIINKGFMVCVIEDIFSSTEPIIEPEGYDIEIISDLSSNESEFNGSEKYPDIIMILNESFYDLAYYTLLTTDVDYMKSFYNIPNSVYGYAISPNIGGGTNNSEFELLYSKSMYLLAGDAPFTYLNPMLEERSVVSYLEQLGYTTTGMHCGGEQNYYRHIAYPAIGFDNIILGPDAFSYISSNGNCSWRDVDNYNDLRDYYESADENPQFIYLLTFQNHGGYEQNADDMDTVHVNEDFGALTDDINEFLSSVKLSAEAFKELTEYYMEVDRDVIICMVGDHAPSFITNLSAKENNLIDDSSINMRTVPYVMWSNFDADFSAYFDYSSMVDLVPMVLEASDISLSAFYSNILELHDSLPIRTRDGKAVNRDLQILQYDESNEYYDLWSRYYYLEYNSLLLTDEYLEKLFMP